MLLLKILLIAAIVLAVLFVLSLLVYFFNLDMKAAALIMPVLEKLYDRADRKRKKKEKKYKNKSEEMTGDI